MSIRAIKVLLIEDNPGDVRLIQEMLSGFQGVEYDLVLTGKLQEGIEILSCDEIDVVLLDLGLPDSKGLDTFSTMNAHVQDIPIVVLTGLGDEKVALNAVQMGAQDYLVKGSVDGLTLSRIIRYAIERKRAETKLRQSEEHYRLLVETMNEGFMELDENSVFRYVNDALCVMLAYSQSEIVGQPITKFFDVSNQEILKKHISLKENSRFQSYEITWTRMDQDKIHTIVSPRPVFDANNQYRGSFAVITNITRIKQATNRLQKYSRNLEEEVMKRTMELRKTREELVRLKQARRD
jgi:PAS domain S-box-containing protein